MTGGASVEVALCRYSETESPSRCRVLCGYINAGTGGCASKLFIYFGVCYTLNLICPSSESLKLSVLLVLHEAMVLARLSLVGTRTPPAKSPSLFIFTLRLADVLARESLPRSRPGRSFTPRSRPGKSFTGTLASKATDVLSG